MAEADFGFRFLTSGYSKSSHGRSVRDSSVATWPPPTQLFFIYLKFETDAQLTVKHYFDGNVGDINNVELTERQFLDAARRGDPPFTKNFENLIWYRPCYITLAIDNSDWRFYWENAQGHDPVRFVSAKERADGVPQFYDANFSFFDAINFDLVGEQITNPPIPPISAVRMTNFHKEDQNGTDMSQGQTRSYCFEIYLEAPFKIGAERITILIDPDSQNQGPP